MALGFKRRNDHDAIFEEQHGYPYFIVDKKICKGIIVNWDIETHELRLYKKHNFVREITPDELNLLLEIHNA